MRTSYDFSEGRRGAVLPSSGKTRITIMLDNDILEHFRERAEAAGRGYQTMINAALREALSQEGGQRPITEERLREILREELRV